MKYKGLVYLIILALCAACGQPPEDVLEGESDQAVVSATRTGTQAQSETATSTELPTQIPVFTSTAEATATIVPTSPITPTLTLSSTIVTSATLTISGTWIYTDVRVTRSGRIHQSDWSRDGEMFAVATTVGGFIYDAHTLEVIQPIYIGENVPSVLINSTNSLAALGSLNGDIRWVDPETGHYIATFEGHHLGVTDLVYPGQGYHMVSGSDDGTVRSWDPAFVIDPDRPGAPPTNVLRLNNRVSCVDINQIGDLAVAGSYQSWVVWNISTGEIVMEQGGSPTQINDIAFSPGGEYLATADGSNILRLWKTSDWSLSHKVTFEETDTITSIDFYPDQLALVIGAKNGVVLQWHITTNEYFEVTSMDSWAVSDIEVHPGGSSILISGENGYLRLVSNQ